jgi:4'-phosphopantetheinyl transferase EntD
MIEELLPADVIAIDRIGHDPAAALLPAELFLIEKAVEKRRVEVTNARTCARRALAGLGLGHERTAILRGAKGQPLWPDGVVGSMTHTKGYYAAAVAESAKVRSVGIDAEEHGELPAGVLRHIAFGAELSWIAAADSSAVWWERLLFSAKESVYKAWFPLTGRWLGFEDAALEFTADPADRTTGTFRARILVDGTTTDGGPPLTELDGRFLVRGGYVLTAIALPPL